jgi:hypothetical protein
MIKTNILEITCVVHANDLLGNLQLQPTCHYIGSYISNNRQYPIFVVMGRLNNDKS